MTEYSIAAMLADLRAYTCPVLDCEVSLPSGRWMCLGHWRLVPAEIRGDVYAAVYRNRRAAHAHHRASGGSGVVNHVDPSPEEAAATEEWMAASSAMHEAQLRAVIVADEASG